MTIKIYKYTTVLYKIFIAHKLCGDISKPNACFTESLCVATSRTLTKVTYKYDSNASLRSNNRTTE